MSFYIAYHTDAGIQKETNQDALCLKTAKTKAGPVAFCAICDGMGGLSKGELASATVIHAFSEWFDRDFPVLLQAGCSFDALKEEWRALLRTQNEKLLAYGSQNGVSLGTTVTAILFVRDRYAIAHVGDCRAYELGDSLLQLTRDQTVVGREVERGNLTPEEARQDPRRNVLLQCVGASRAVAPDFVQGKAKAEGVYLLCTDGFRHELFDTELYDTFRPAVLTDENEMRRRAKDAVELVKARSEQDNITVALIKRTGLEEAE